MRRRLILALAAITVALVGLSGWGFYRLSHGTGMTSGEITRAPTAFILFMFMFSFIVALARPQWPRRGLRRDRLRRPPGHRHPPGPA